MTDRKKPRGEMLMDIGAQAVAVERLRFPAPGVSYGLRKGEKDRLRRMCVRYLATQQLEP